MQQQSSVKPLTHTNAQTGQPFERTPSVAKKIIEVLSLEHAALIRRINIKDRDHPQFLPEECLVYLLRENSATSANRWLVSDIFDELRKRIERFLAFELRTLDPDRREDAWQDVMDVLYTKITAPDDIGDFAQVNFRSFLAAKVSDVKRRYYRQQKRDRNTVAPAWAHGSEPADDLEPHDTYAEPAVDYHLGEELMNQELLAALEPNDRRLVELRLLGLPIEHKDPTVPTISKYFGVTPRTINNRLRSLQRSALEWLEKERGS